MKHVLYSIIYDAQTAFVKGWDIDDNISLAHEPCLDLLPNAKKNIFVDKIDLCKAFDSINRNVMLYMMGVKGFPSCFIDWIETCISNINFSIILNSEIHGFFSFY